MFSLFNNDEEEEKQYEGSTVAPSPVAEESDEQWEDVEESNLTLIPLEEAPVTTEEEWEDVDEAELDIVPVEAPVPQEAPSSRTTVAEDQWEEVEDPSSLNIITPINVAPQGATEQEMAEQNLVPALPEGKEGLDREDIVASPDRMKIIRDYLGVRMGEAFKGDDISDDEAYDAFINRMRGMNSNEVSLGMDIWALSQADQDGRVAMGKAYTMFDQMNSMWTSDGIMGAVDGVWDYGSGVLTSPSTWLGVGVGKLVAQGGMTAARTTAMKAAMETARQGAIKAATTQGLSRVAAVEAGEQAVKETALVAAKTSAYRTALTATAVDGAAATMQDYFYQDQKINAGAQDEYSLAQTLLSSGTAIVAGGLGGYLDFKAVSSATPSVAGTIKEGNKTAKLQATRQLNEGLEEELKKYGGELGDWIKATERGERLNLDSTTLQRKLFEDLFGKKTEEGQLLPGLFEKTMKAAGYVLRDEDGKAQQMIQIVRDLPAAERGGLTRVFKRQTGLTLGEVLDTMSLYVRQTGKDQNTIGQVAKRVGTVSSARRLAQDTIDSIKVKDAGPVGVRAIQYTQSLWRRSVVSHFATTAVNVKGWAGGYAARNFAQIVHGGVLGSAGMAAKLAAPVSAKAKAFSDKTLQDSKALFDSEAFVIQSLLNPFDTKQTFDALLEEMPKRNKQQLVNEGFSGVETSSAGKGKDAAKPYGFDPDTNKVVRFTEGLMDQYSKVSLMKLQDMTTKSQSFVTSLDRELRLETGIGLVDTLKKSGTYNVSDEIWDRATNTALKDIFSMDYTKGSNIMNRLANLSETVSATPIIGFAFPFARFMNNAMAFTYRFSPLNVISATKYLKQGDYDDAGKAYSEAAMGSAFIGYMINREAAKEAEGLKWFEERDEEGVIRDRTNEFPMSLFSWSGRFFLQALPGWAGGKGEKISEDLWADGLNVMGAPGGVQSLSQDLQGIGTFILNGVDSFRQEGEGGGWSKLLAEIAAAGGGIASGFTRPFEPLNTLVGAATDENLTTPDRRRLEGGDRVISESLRYVDNIFYAASGAENPKDSKPRMSITQDGPVIPTDVLGQYVSEKAAASHSSVDKMLGQANMQAWRLLPRSNVPEYDAAILERTFDILGPRADALIHSEVWRTAKQHQRQKIVRDLMSTTKEEIVGWIESNPGSTEALDRLRYKWSMKDKTLREDAKRLAGITASDKSLSFYDLQMLNDYIAIIDGRYKELSK